jgi:hypothetical protein
LGGVIILGAAFLIYKKYKKWTQTQKSLS